VDHRLLLDLYAIFNNSYKVVLHFKQLQIGNVSFNSQYWSSCSCTSPVCDYACTLVLSVFSGDGKGHYGALRRLSRLRGVTRDFRWWRLNMVWIGVDVIIF
jgi:hypothetical protein